MARYIDAVQCAETLSERLDISLQSLVDVFVEIPTADVVEVEHGKWNIEESKEFFNVVCSNCDKDFYVYKKGQYRIQSSNYCPNCGARMDGAEQ